jgi:nicotinic acid mononucleotide adenylyltransferase
MELAAYDLSRLLAFRDALETLDIAAPPTARVLYPESLPTVRRVGILCGSFNPLTLAHAELAEQARDTARLDLVLLTMAKVTVDKERVTGLSLEDRLLLLSLYAQRRERTGIAIVNRGLYFEQAQAFRSLLGAKVEIAFVVGMDKLLQILDPKYYDERNAALRQLFSLTSLIVANRGEMAREAFDQLLDQPGNRPYRAHITFCHLPETVSELSATEVREALETGKEVGRRVPEETAVFLAETRAFHPLLDIGGEKIDAYAVRQRVFELLSADRSHPVAGVDFCALVQAARTADKRGKTL